MQRKLTIAAAAAKLGIDRKVLLRWVESNAVPVEKLKDGRRLITEAWCNMMLKRMAQREQALQREADAAQAGEEDEEMPAALMGDEE